MWFLINCIYETLCNFIKLSVLFAEMQNWKTQHYIKYTYTDEIDEVACNSTVSRL